MATGKKVAKRPAPKKAVKKKKTTPKATAAKSPKVAKPKSRPVNPYEHKQYLERRSPQSKSEALEQLAVWAEERKNLTDGKTFLRVFTAYDARVIALGLKDFQQFRLDDKAFNFDIFYDGIKDDLVGRFPDGRANEKPEGITRKKTYNKCATIVTKVNALIKKEERRLRANGATQEEISSLVQGIDGEWRTPLLSEKKFKSFNDEQIEDLLGFGIY